MKLLSGISEISSNYDFYIFDVWGVIHDGIKLYPEVLNSLNYLRSLNKKICFLSNAPRRAIKVKKLLEKFGITEKLYDFIITSGEVAHIELEKNQKNSFHNFGQKYFYIGPKKDMDLLDDLSYISVENAKEADFAITTGFDNENSVLSEKLPYLLEAKNHDLPMLCVNPDLIVIRQDGKEMICAGILALEYEKNGGRVIYYGKPFSKVYETVYEMFNKPSKNKIIAIGDGLETDINGANEFKIDNILVTGGILSNKLGIKFWQNPEEKKLISLCSEINTFPKFSISNLKI
jgi:HAD superfamily hydrolase (TIGR01459 family)